MEAKSVFKSNIKNVKKMITDEYLVARIGAMVFGIYCRDVKNVYSEKIKLVKLYYQTRIFRGVAHIDGQVMQLIDLRRRVGMEDHSGGEMLTVISFQTNMSTVFGVVVDEIIGMKKVSEDQLITHSSSLNNSNANINLLFPMVALLEDGEMIHLLDSTYLDKTEQVLEEETGDLELF